MIFKVNIIDNLKTSIRRTIEILGSSAEDKKNKNIVVAFVHKKILILLLQMLLKNLKCSLVDVERILCKVLSPNVPKC